MCISDPLLKYKIALEIIPHIGSITAKKLIAYCGGIGEVFNHIFMNTHIGLVEIEVFCIIDMN